MPTIQSIRISPVSFRLKTPFVTAAGQKSETHNVSIALTLDDGTCGIAEASSSIAMPKESQTNLTSALRQLIPELRGRRIEEVRELISTTWRLQAIHPTAAAAMECALLDAYTRSLKISLASHFGGKLDSVETDLTLSVAEPQVLFKRAKAAAKKGFRRLKVKVSGVSAVLDHARMAAVHKGAPRALLVADGNQGFRLSQALDFLHQLKRSQISIAFFEQPFQKHDLRSMKLLRQRTHVPIFADEAVLSVADAVRVFDANAADGVIVKVAKSGLLGACEIIQICRRLNKRVGIGCMEESKAGLAASVHLACGTGAFEWVDLDSVFLLSERGVRGGFHIRGPNLSVKGIGAGIGI